MLLRRQRKARQRKGREEKRPLSGRCNVGLHDFIFLRQAHPTVYTTHIESLRSLMLSQLGEMRGSVVEKAGEKMGKSGFRKPPPGFQQPFTVKMSNSNLKGSGCRARHLAWPSVCSTLFHSELQNSAFTSPASKRAGGVWLTRSWLLVPEPKIGSAVSWPCSLHHGSCLSAYVPSKHLCEKRSNRQKNHQGFPQCQCRT